MALMPHVRHKQPKLLLRYPAVGVAMACMPNSLAFDTAALIPLALNEPVGLPDSSFQKTSLSPSKAV
jgi:hypothetical protein